MHKRSVEIAVGFFVALGLAALVMLAMQVSNLTVIGSNNGYFLNARFDNVGGLKVRSPVVMAGVRVGQVQNLGLDGDTFEAIVTFSVDAQYRLPLDTGASIMTSGLLGEQYVLLEPGGEETMLKDGDEIKLTQSAMMMERVIGQFLFNKAAGDE